MNVQQLRVFTVAAKCRTLTEVAQELNIKQPTVSFHLKKLESDLGVELFYKKHRFLRLTEVGAVILPYARKITSLLDETAQVIKEYREDGRGTLKIGASYTPATYFLLPHLAAFQNDYPHVLPVLTVKKARTIMELLLNYEIDVAIVSLSQGQRAGLHVIPLIPDELKLVMSIHHPLTDKEQIQLSDLWDEPFLVHEHGSTSRELAEVWAQENNFRLKIQMELGAIETIKESVKHNMGISILPHRSILHESGQRELIVRDLPGYVNRRYICLVYRQDDVLSYHVKSFMTYMQSVHMKNPLSP